MNSNERTAEQWRHSIEAFETERRQVAARLEAITGERQRLSVDLLDGDRTAGEKIARLDAEANELRLRDRTLVDALAVAGAELRETKFKEGNEAREARAAQLAALGEKRDQAARAVKASVAKVLEALSDYDVAAGEHYRLGRRQYGEQALGERGIRPPDVQETYRTLAAIKLA